jgi:hypothetical protein
LPRQKTKEFFICLFPGYIWFGPHDILLEVMLLNYRLNQAENVSHECSFLITDKSYLTVEYGLAFAKNSSLTPLFNQAYNRHLTYFES